MKLYKQIPILCKAIPLGIMLSALFSVSVAAAQPGIITANSVNIRSGPSSEAEILGQASENQSVTILLYDENFYMVNIGTYSNVFISRGFIERVEATDQLLGTAVRSANIRAGNSTAYEVVGTANEGDVFPVLANVDGWYKITYNSQTAYIYGEFLSVEADLQESAQQVSPAETVVAGYMPEELTHDNMPSDFAALLASVWDAAEEVIEDNLTESQENNYEPTAPAPIINTDRTFNPQSNVHAVVSSSTGLNLRTSPTTESEAITILHPMQSLNVYDIFSDWARVSTMDGRNSGYVNVEFITIRTGSRQAPPPANYEKAQQIIYFARMFIGTPYLFGGTDLQSGVDCSGFIFSVMREFGITLGRSSRDMINNGIPIEREDIAPGDLLFFSANGTVVTHVALYMGNNQFIHSTDTRGLGVSFASLTSDHSQRTYFGARRVIK